MVDVPAMFADQRDEITKSGEFSDRGISVSEIGLFVSFNY
jgi:hypothetical protein